MTEDYPRQTDILSPWVDDQWFTETDRERGQAVHKACNALIRDLFVPYSKLYQGYTISFQNWAETMVVETLYAEGWAKIDGEWQHTGPLISRLFRFLGTPDWIGWLKGDIALAIVDWKTSLSKQKIWQLQVSGAYRILAEENGYKPIGRCLSLRLDKDGGQVKLDEYGSLMDTAYFLRALDLWRFFNA